jgi:hypothetical protein
MPSIKRFRRVLLIVLIWVVAIAALLEIGMRLVGPKLPGQLGVTARWVITGQPYAEDWTPAWIENPDHYHILRPGIDNALQYGSAAVSFHLTTIELWDGGGIGFRTRPVDYFVDAVVVGDSFGFCFTELEDCWVTILERETGMGMVNLSQPVTGTVSHERILETFGAPMTPPLVIWQFFGNDFNDDYGLAVFRGDIEAIDDDETESESGASVLDWLSTHSAAFAVLEQALTGHWRGLPEGERLYDKPYRVTYGDNNALEFGGLYERLALDMSIEKNQVGLEYSREAFVKALDLVKSWDGTLVVMLIPTREEVYADLTADQMGEDAMRALASSREAMLGLCDELDMLCLDLLPGLQEHALQNEALYYTDDMHLNPHGNAVTASLLADWLGEQGLLPQR